MKLQKEHGLQYRSSLGALSPKLQNVPAFVGPRLYLLPVSISREMLRDRHPIRQDVSEDLPVLVDAGFVRRSARHERRA